MLLKEFIKETLSQIIEGVKESQESLKDSGAEISKDYFEQNILFDVSLTQVEEKGGKKGIGLNFQFLSADMESGKNTKGESVARVSFKVPTALPYIKNKSDDYKFPDFDLNK